MKRFPLVVLAALGLSISACGGGGGGGGDEEAFCDALETLSDQVADGDLADDDGLEDVTDTVNDLLQAADEGEQLDAVNAVGDEIEAASADDADATAETVQDELADFAEDCDIDEDEFAAPPTTEEEPDTTTSDTTEDTEPPDTGETVPPEGGDQTVTARADVPGDIAAEFAGLAQGCFDGDMAACDQLFAQTPVGSPDEAYGASCGGRLAEPAPNQCAQIITGPVDLPAEIAPEFLDLANACFGGDMVACDDLFQQTPVDSIDEAYGLACGGRVPARDVTCAEIFGEVAFL